MGECISTCAGSNESGRLADLFHHDVHLGTTKDSGVKRNYRNTNRRVARRAESPWLGDRALCHYARSCAFLLLSELGAKPLPIFMQRWKEWSSKRISRELKLSGRLWQQEFFDHLLRSSESYSQKWDYVKENPVRAGLVKSSDRWPWQGEIESLML